jgi:hypothetical protein
MLLTAPKRLTFMVLLSLSVLAGVPGCSDNSGTVPVSGKVVFPDGSPLDHGIIEMRHSLLPQVARGEIDSEGQFSVSTFKPGDGALPGEYQVAVTQLIIAEDLSFEDHQHGKRLDPRFSRVETSNLTVVVDEDQTNDLVIQVDSPPEDQ